MAKRKEVDCVGEPVGENRMVVCMGFAVGVAVCLLTLATAHAEWINIRVIHEGAGNLLLEGGNGPQVPVHPHTAGLSRILYTLPISKPIQLVENGTGAVVFSYLPKATDFGQQYSLFVTGTNNVTKLADTIVLQNMDGIDIARLRVLNAISPSTLVNIKGVTSNCHNCRRPWLCTLGYGGVTGLNSLCLPSVGVSVESTQGYLQLDVRHSFVVEVTDLMGATIFLSDLSLREHSSHDLILRSLNGTPAVELVQDFVGNNVWIPLLIAAGIVLAVAVLMSVALCFARRDARRRLGDPLNQSIQSIGASSVKPKSASRVTSVDTFRGIALSIMIFVNYGGGGYWFLDHSKWNGLTVADLVFPWFMWMMGVSLAMSLSGQVKHGSSRRSMSWKIIVRSVKLFLLGMFINNGQVVDNWRILGVLQYFGVACLVNGLVEVWFPVFDTGCACKRVNNASPDRHRDDDDHHTLLLSQLMESTDPRDNEVSHFGTPKVSSTAALFGDVWAYRFHFLFMSAILGAYLALQYLLPVPGCPTGYIGPGGLAMPVGQEHCTGGAHRYIDLKLFGEDHIYHFPLGTTAIPIATCADTYECAEYDPEGTLGMLTATVMTFLGVQAGRVIVKYRAISHSAMIKRWVVWGVVLGSIGTALCSASKNDGIMPLNKNLWSPSFIAVMSGTGFLALTACYVLVDMAKLWSGNPFRFVGMNSILVYAGSEVLQGYFPFSFQDHRTSDNFTGGLYMTHAGKLAVNIVGVCCWYTIAYLMYRSNFFYNL